MALSRQYLALAFVDGWLGLHHDDKFILFSEVLFLNWLQFWIQIGDCLGGIFWGGVLNIQVISSLVINAKFFEIMACDFPIFFSCPGE